MAGGAVSFDCKCLFPVVTKSAGCPLLHLLHRYGLVLLSRHIRLRMALLAGESFPGMAFMAEGSVTEAVFHDDVAAADLGSQGQGKGNQKYWY